MPKNDLIPGFRPYEENDPLSAGETPGTDAFNASLEELAALFPQNIDFRRAVSGIMMVPPGRQAKTQDVVPHTKKCEASLQRAAQLIQQAIAELKLGIHGQ